MKRSAGYGTRQVEGINKSYQERRTDKLISFPEETLWLSTGKFLKVSALLFSVLSRSRKQKNIFKNSIRFAFLRLHNKVVKLSFPSRGLHCCGFPRIPRNRSALAPSSFGITALSCNNQREKKKLHKILELINVYANFENCLFCRIFVIGSA